MNMKKWLYLLAIVVITGIILFFYVSFNSTFVSKWKAKQIGIDYLNNVYEEDEYMYESVGFNFKDQTYFVRYSARTDAYNIYEASVEIEGGLWPTTVVGTYLSEPSRNEAEDEKINQAAQEELKHVLAAFDLKEVNYSIEAPTVLDYTVDSFSIYEKYPLKPDISLASNLQLSDEEAKILVKKIRETLNAANVYYVDFIFMDMPKGSNSWRLKYRVDKKKITRY